MYFIDVSHNWSFDFPLSVVLRLHSGTHTHARAHAQSGEHNRWKAKGRSLIFVRRWKPQGGCFPLAASNRSLPAALFDPQCCRDHWGEREREKKRRSRTPFAWLGRLLEAEQSGQQRLGPGAVQLLAGRMPPEPLFGAAARGNRAENLDMCHGRSLQSCVLRSRYATPGQSYFGATVVLEGRSRECSGLRLTVTVP